MENINHSASDIKESVEKILEILNGKCLKENKMILEKVHELIEGFSILKC